MTFKFQSAQPISPPSCTMADPYLEDHAVAFYIASTGALLSMVPVC